MKLTEITLDLMLQPRVAMSQETIDDYTEALREGAKFPPVIVFYDGSCNYLVDGWQRFHANKKAGFLDIEVTVIKGSHRDAFLYSTGANKDHGLPRSSADKRKIVMSYMDDVELSEWSDRQIQKQTGISASTVSRVRKSLGLVRDTVKAVKNGKEVELKVNKKDDNIPAIKEADYENEIAKEMEAIVEENETLTNRLAVYEMDKSDEKKQVVESKLVEMASEIKTLTATLNAAQSQSTAYMNQVADLKQQVNYWKKRAEKAERQIK